MIKRRRLACALVLLGSLALSANGGAAAADDPRDQAVLAKLQEPIRLSFKNALLEDVLRFIKVASQGPADNGVPIFVDPEGLRAAGATMTTLVSVESKEGEALKSSLERMLKSVNLAYQVRGGLLRIVHPGRVEK